MANLLISNIDEVFYKEIKALADSENRSVSQQVLFLLKGYLKKVHAIEATTPAKVLLDLGGTWQDDRDADEIINDIKKNRVNSREFSEVFIKCECLFS